MMYDLLTKVSQIEKSVPYQPEYPLKYSDRFGPWAPILSREDSLRQDFKFLMLTEPGEWPMDPELGIGLRKYLFENYNSESLRGIESRIRDQLEKYLSSVSLISAGFTADPDDVDRSRVSLMVVYSIMGAVQEVSRIQLGEKGYLVMEIQQSSKTTASGSEVMPLSSKVKTI